MVLHGRAANFLNTPRKICQKHALFTSFRDYTLIFLILFFDRFCRIKKSFRVIFRVLCKNLTQKYVSQL